VTVLCLVVSASFRPGEGEARYVTGRRCGWSTGTGSRPLAGWLTLSRSRPRGEVNAAAPRPCARLRCARADRMRLKSRVRCGVDGFGKPHTLGHTRRLTCGAPRGRPRGWSPRRGTGGRLAARAPLRLQGWVAHAGDRCVVACCVFEQCGRNTGALAKDGIRAPDTSDWPHRCSVISAESSAVLTGQNRLCAPSPV